MKYFAWLMLAVTVSALIGTGPLAAPRRSDQPAALRYLSPPSGAQFVPPSTTVALRLAGSLNRASLSQAAFSAVGSVSGWHTAQAFLADDGATVVYRPDRPFVPGEAVTVTIASGLAQTDGAVFAGLQTGFTISAGQPAVKRAALDDEDLPAGAAISGPASPPAGPQAVAVHPQDFVTFPHDFPAYTVTVPASGTAPGLLFLAPFQTAGVPKNFLFIADDSGQPVFWQPANANAFDFKKQPDGSLTYYDGGDGLFHVYDQTYSETKTIAAANGYIADLHELQILPNQHALLLIYDPEITSTVQFGGFPTATVTGLIIQELDTSGLPVFQWDSWSHFSLSDTQVSLTTPTVDYVHGNALERDQDGNLLLSSRNLSEITKIDRQTGAVIWRWGGKANEFSSLTPDPEGPFYFQHDVRRQPNGNLTLFDNHNVPGGFSRAIEYQLDETNKIFTNTWEYRNNPDIYSIATGSNQRLPDGHRLIDWGFGHPSLTEVLTDGTKLFEMNLDPAYISYRAFRTAWTATPGWDPLLVLTGTTPTLYYSWNGATDVAAYNIFGGAGPTPNILIIQQARTGFEDHTDLSAAPSYLCAFRIQPVNHANEPQRFSNTVYSRQNCPTSLFLTFWPLIFKP